MRYTPVPAICAAVLLAVPLRAVADAANPLAELVDAAAQRLQVGDDVAAIKWRTGAAVSDPARVQQQLTRVVAAAAADHLDPGYVRQVFTDQIAATEAVEHYRFAQWTLDPAAAPAAPPDLAVSRARIDGLNHDMLAQIAQRWPQLHSPQCGTELDTATRDVSTARHLDGFAQQALSAATRAYCSG